MSENINPYNALTDPLTSASTIVPSANDLAKPTRAIHCNASTTATVIFANATAPVDLALVGGQTYPYRLKRVSAVSDSATLIALF